MAEVLHVQFLQQGHGSISAPDTKTAEFEIYISKKRDSGEATKFMNTTITNHYMDNDVEIAQL